MRDALSLGFQLRGVITLVGLKRGFRRNIDASATLFAGSEQYLALA